MARHPLAAITLALTLPVSAHANPDDLQAFEDAVRETTKRVGDVDSKWDGELTTRDVAASRQLYLYDDGGHADLRYWARTLDGKDAESIFLEQRQARIRAREFIWSHWESRRRGYIRLTWDSVDAVSTSHIFIEPIESGTWRVAWRIVRGTGVIHDRPDSMRVERGACDGKDGSCILMFVDRNGTELDSL
jgi:hypothetical protein